MAEKNNQKSADAIANERENFRNLFRQTPEMVCILNGPEHRFEFVNEAHVRALGFDATGKTVREAQPESVEVHGILDQVYSTGKTAELHEIPITVTNRLRYFNLTYAAKRDVSGKVNGVMILGTEITDQLLNREILISQNQALEMTMNDSPLEEVLAVLARGIETIIGRGALASILLLDKEGKHLRLGAAPSLPRTYSKIIDGLAIGPKVGSCGTAAYANKEVIVNDISSDPLWEGFHELAAEFGLKSCWSTPVRSSSGKLMGTFALYNRPPKDPNSQEQQVVDLITRTAAIVIERHLEAIDKRETESAVVESGRRLRLSEERLQMAVEVAKVGFYDWDIINDVVIFSRQMLKDWGLKSQIGGLEDVVQYIHEDDRARVVASIQDSLKFGTPYHREYRVRQPGGKVIWIDVKGAIHKNAAGVPEKFFGTCVDITDHKEREARILEAQRIAESANAAKGMFLANMSHEIRTPLGAIMGFLDLLKGARNSKEDLSSYIGVIDRNSKQLLRIVDDVLDLSKIEAGKFSMEAIEFSLLELFRDFSALMAFKAREKGLRYEIQFITPLPDLAIGDPTRIRQILTNVVGNAIKFTEAGHVAVRVAFSEGTVKIEVEDTGCGIHPDAALKLFKPFAQADDSTTRVYGGTGLGLSLSRRLSEALGGNFHLEKSKVGEGSLFVASLPLKLLPSTKLLSIASLDSFLPKEEEQDLDANALSGLRILIADDAEDNQDLISILLQQWGAETAVAQNGKEAVEIAGASTFDVILMDVQMPFMDGHEATKILRAKGYHKPIIALTAHAMKEERERCRQSGFTAFLSKPIDKEALLSALLEQKKV